MKKLFLLIALLLPLYAQAANYLGFGGGNYVYAEQGNLYFNLDKSAFDHRKWSYDGEKFTSQFSVKMDLKTKYTSGDWMEQVLANKKSDGLMYANYIKQPFNYQNRGGFQKTAIPYFIGLAGGFIARQFAFNNLKRWAVGTAFGYGVAKYLCSKLMDDGITCDAANAVNGAFTRTVTYAYELKETGNHGMGTFTVRATPSQYNSENGLANVVRHHVLQVHSATGNKLKNCVSKAGDGNVNCNYPWENGKDDWFSTDYFSGLSQPVTITEIVSDPEIDTYLDATCKLFPSECINEPTGGKNINDVQLTAGAITGGGVSVTGPPYTNPITGDSQQDHVVIGGSSAGTGVPSSTNTDWTKDSKLGQSTTTNTVEVTTTARPDLTGTTDVAKPNEQTGTKPQVVNPSVPDVNIEFPEFTDIAEFCQQNPRANACIEFEEVEKQKDADLPEIQEKFEFNKLNIFATDGLCPQGSQFSIGVLGINKTFEFSYQPACDFAVKLRYVLIAIAMLIALKIVFGFGGVKK